MDFKELRKQTGMSQRAFAEYFGIPTRTVENWDGGQRACPTYLLDLMRYKLEKEGLIEEVAPAIVQEPTGSPEAEQKYVTSVPEGFKRLQDGSIVIDEAKAEIARAKIDNFLKGKRGGAE